MSYIKIDETHPISGGPTHRDTLLDASYPDRLRDCGHVTMFLTGRERSSDLAACGHVTEIVRRLAAAGATFVRESPKSAFWKRAS